MVKARLEPLTGVRAFAALWVVLFHTSLATSPLVPGALRSFLGAGYSAVSLFFVLSGFILAYNYADRLREPGSGFWAYFLARVARIYPLYLVALVLGLAALAVWGKGFDGFSFVSQIFGLHALLLMVPGTVNMPSWSISCEFFFYAVFPLVIWAARGRGPRFWWAGAGLAAAVGLATPLAYAVLIGDQPVGSAAWVAIHFHPLVRLPEFLLGVFVGLLFNRGESFGWLSGRWVGVFWGSVGVVALAAIFCPTDYAVVLHSGGLAVPFVVMILALANGAGRVGEFFATGPMVWLGEISYGIYILQAPVKVLAERFLPGAGGLAGSLVVLALMILVPALAYYLVERPGRRFVLGLGKKVAGAPSG